MTHFLSKFRFVYIRTETSRCHFLMHQEKVSSVISYESCRIAVPSVPSTSPWQLHKLIVGIFDTNPFRTTYIVDLIKDMDSGGEETTTCTLLRVGTFNVHGWTDGNHEDNFERVVDLIGT